MMTMLLDVGGVGYGNTSKGAFVGILVALIIVLVVSGLFCKKLIEKAQWEKERQAWLKKKAETAEDEKTEADEADGESETLGSEEPADGSGKPDFE
ncbi:MAG: hypothetical protein K6E50_15570 [Lachnospiraceae bacterium]|nr:hypothetical protein [Lachnospiraceae bacterium]